jgi:hypothetical protein
MTKIEIKPVAEPWKPEGSVILVAPDQEPIDSFDPSFGDVKTTFERAVKCCRSESDET